MVGKLPFTLAGTPLGLSSHAVLTHQILSNLSRLGIASCGQVLQILGSSMRARILQLPRTADNLKRRLSNSGGHHA